MKTGESLLSIGKFIAEYSAHLMGAGVHTSRVVRNTKRIGEAFGLDVKLSVFHRNIILTIIDKETNEACNEVIDIPAHPISFEHNSELSALSWEAVDNHLPLVTDRIIKNILIFCANSNNNPMVNTTTEQGMTGEVISGNESPRANETKGYIKGIANST